MSRYESNIKPVSSPSSSVYAKLSDLRNLEAIKERLSDPNAQEMLKGKIPEDKMEQVKKQLDTLEVTADTLSINADMLGKLTIKVVERDPEKCVKYESVNSPIGFTLWVQMLPTSDMTSKIKLTLDASLNPFIMAMVDKPLREGIEKLADMLAMIPY